jgi:hypothetical protein
MQGHLYRTVKTVGKLRSRYMNEHVTKLLTFPHPGLYWIYGNKDDDEKTNNAKQENCMLFTSLVSNVTWCSELSIK